MQRSDEYPLPVTRRRYLAVAQTLLTAIQQGRFQPGGRLPSDRELAERLGVSRPTAREALLALELIGAINVRHGDGTYISEMHHRFFHDAGLDFGSSPAEVMQARITVEPPVSGLLTGRVNPEELDRIQADLDAAAGMIDDLGALPAFVELSLRFHGRLAALCENRILNHVVSELVDIDRQPLWALLNQMVLRTKQSRVTVLEEHQAILDTVRAGDPDAAERVMRAHLQENKRQLFMEDIAW
jgi:DNA-binding FadR family transcriptional regulator